LLFLLKMLRDEPDRLPDRRRLEPNRMNTARS